jgi:hypothetical protein
VVVVFYNFFSECLPDFFELHLWVKTLFEDLRVLGIEEEMVVEHRLRIQILSYFLQSHSPHYVEEPVAHN